MGDLALHSAMHARLETTTTTNSGFSHSLTDGYEKLMSPNKGETAGCHCPCDMVVCMREVTARPWICVCVPLALIYR